MSGESQHTTSFWKIVEKLPLILPAAIAAFGVIAIALLLCGQLRSELVFPLGLLAVIAVTFAIIRTGYNLKRPGTRREQRLGDLLVIIGALLWCGWNIHYTSQNIYIDRDPAAYNDQALWYVDHHDFKVGSPYYLAQNPHVTDESSGFLQHPSDRSHLTPFGPQLLPVLGGLTGRVLGKAAVLHINPLLAAGALVVIYGYARLLVRPRWALLSVGVLSLSLPFLYFARDMYTEPLSALLTFGALSLLWMAMTHRQLIWWFLTGLVTGTCVLARIDASPLIGMVVAVALLRRLFVGKKGVKVFWQEIFMLLAGLIPTFVIAWLSLTYLTILHDNRRPFLLSIGVALLLVGVALSILLVERQKQVLQRWNSATLSWRGTAVVAVIILSVLVMLARPWWHSPDPHHYVVRTLGGRQVVLEDPSLPGGSLGGESTTNWIVWYIGSGLATLGVLGLALLAKRAAYRKDLLLWPGLLVVFVMSFAYLYSPSITPDQLWSTRRFLPLTIPGLLIGAAVMFDYLQRHLDRAFWRRVLLGGLLIFCVTSPLLASGFFWRSRSYDQELVQLESACRLLPPKAVVLWGGTIGFQAVQASRSVCGVTALRLRDLDRPALASVARDTLAAGYKPIIAFRAPDNFLAGFDTHQLTFVSDISYGDLEMTLTRPPQKIVHNHTSLLLGQLQADGTVQPLKAR